MSNNEGPFQHVTNRMMTIPGMGKSKLMKKWLKKSKKKGKKFKWKKIKAAKTKPSDLMGFLTPSSNFTPPPWYRRDEYKREPLSQEFFDEIPKAEPEVQALVDHMFKERNGEVWDLRDEDGDLHSPSWYLDAFITAREAYMEAREKVANAGDSNEHDAELDYTYEELDRYGTYINKLFGSDMVDGVWNRSDEDE